MDASGRSVQPDYRQHLSLARVKLRHRFITKAFQRGKPLFFSIWIYTFLLMKEKLLNYIKSFNWKFLFIFAAVCILLAILNNIRVDDSKSVEWIGSQEVFEKPEGF